MNYPEFVLLHRTAMRLVQKDFMWEPLPGYTYRRDNWRWDLRWFEERDGKLYSIMPTMPELHNVELIPITEEEWSKDNNAVLTRTITTHVSILSR